MSSLLILREELLCLLTLDVRSHPRVSDSVLLDIHERPVSDFGFDLSFDVDAGFPSLTVFIWCFQCGLTFKLSESTGVTSKLFSLDGQS